MSRRNARINVFKLVYEYCISGETNELSLAEATKSSREKPEVDDAVMEIIKSRYSGSFVSEEDDMFELVEEKDKRYIAMAFDGIKEHKDRLEDIIRRYARDYRFERLFRVDKAILLVALYEILYMDDIPFKVSVNEAVELAKDFSTERSAGYINGILASVIRDSEELKNECADN